jgi:hypothetical protein
MQRDGLNEAVKVFQWIGNDEQLQEQGFAKILEHIIKFFKKLQGREILAVRPQFKSLQVDIDRQLL